MNFKDWLNSEDSDVWTSDGADGARQAWDYQQNKIDNVFHYLDTLSHPLDFSIEEIKEILK